MSYAGQAYQIPCAAGGSFYSPNLDGVPPESMIDPSKNINMHTGGRTKRGGTTHADSAAISGAPTILNGFDFRKKSTGARSIVRFASTGSLYKDNTTTIKTGMAISGRPCFENFLDTLFITDGQTSPQTWDGAAAATSNITTPATDWTGTHQPKYCLAHGIGASARMWYLGVDNQLDRLYYSKLGDGKDLTATGSGFFTVETSDGFGLTGAAEFGQRLIAFGKNKAFLIADTDASTANWGAVPAQWEGGVAHHNLLVKTPNDLIAMTEDGEIYSVRAVQSYGDYQTASIARPAFIHSWIKDNVNIALIDQFHAVYDRQLRAIKFFIVRNGKSVVDTALVFFIDRPAAQAWQIHDNIVTSSAYDASCAFEVRESAGIYTIYTGDYAGWLWKTEQTAKDDNSLGFVCQFKTPPLDFGNPRTLKKFRRGKIVFAAPGNYNVNLRWWVDNVEMTPRIVAFTNTGSTYDGSVYGTATYAGPNILDADFELGAIGKRIQLQLENSVADQDFFVSKIMIDNEVVGARES